MTDFIQYQENAESLISHISAQLNELEQKKSSNNLNSNKQANSTNTLISELENIIQSIVAESSIWAADERRESRNYVTQLRIQLTEFQTRLVPFLGEQSAENTTITFNENTAEDGMDAPLIARRSDLHDSENPNQSTENEENSDLSLNVEDPQTQSKCIFVTRIVLSIMLIIAMIIVLIELYK